MDDNHIDISLEDLGSEQPREPLEIGELGPEDNPSSIEVSSSDLENDGWGEGSIGYERRRQYEWIERQLKLLEIMLEPAISRRAGTIDLTEENADQIERSALAIARQGATGADAEYWDRYMKERKTLFDTSVEKALELYADYMTISKVWEGPHRLQERVAGRDALSTCVIASALNALDALGIETGDSETDVIDRVGGPSVFDRNGYLPLSYAEAYLREKGATVRSDTVNLFTLIRHLNEGGVAVVAYGGHARMISAMEASHGSIRFRVHDPLRPDPEMLTIQDLAAHLSTAGVRSNLMLVKR